jgi:hypothetical protein
VKLLLPGKVKCNKKAPAVKLVLFSGYCLINLYRCCFFCVTIFKRYIPAGYFLRSITYSSLIIGDEAFETAAALGVEVLARIRSTGPLRPATVSVENGTVVVDLAEGEEGVSPGQACVFYAATGGGERLLGGGWIKSADGAWRARDDLRRL